MRAVLVTALAILEGYVCVLALGSQVSPWRDRSPHEVRRVTVESTIQLQVLDWGGSGTSIVLLGCYVSAHMYDEFAPKLTNGFHVYGITRRGVGESDKPESGYTVQRSADDVLEVLDALNVDKAILVGHSCAGQILTLFAAQHAGRLHGLVYLDGASDPTMTPSDVGHSMPDRKILPPPIKPPAPPDNRSFEALRASQLNSRGWAFPEGELLQQYVQNPDGSVSQSTMPSTIRRAITIDARLKPDYSRIRVPVLAIYQRELPFDDVATKYAITEERQRAALFQEYSATRAMYDRWQRDLRHAVPSARIVDLPGASLYMFLSNESDVLREVRAFSATLTSK
jgi:non-heme chloroperoxidase